MTTILNIIRINIDPDLIDAGGVTVTWHGFFTFIGVLVALILVTNWAKRRGIVPDTVHSIAVIGIFGAIIGARIFHVLDFWDRIYQHDPIRIFYIWQGGIGIIGAITGGFIFSAGYMLIRNRDCVINFWNKFFRWLGRLEKIDMPPIGKLADITAPALLISQTLGRIGDVINGEHFAKATEFAWAFVYTHPQTEALYLNAARYPETPTHPAVAYEMIWNMVSLGILWFIFRDRLKPDGMLFAMYATLYSFGRFFISFAREDRIYIVGLDAAQMITLTIMVIGITLLISKANWSSKKHVPG
jgi:phosphatidylglycerol:prolipoprotein diacylglycerol transferase